MGVYDRSHLATSLYIAIAFVHLAIGGSRWLVG